MNLPSLSQLPDSAMPPWRFGGALLDPPLVLAPMAGFTDAPMRWVSRQHGAGLTHTEMANARAVADGAEASLRILETLPDEGLVSAHLYGAVPEEFARAAEVVTAQRRHASIDINCGCPVPKVTQCGAGAALMADPALIGRIVRATVEHTSLPVTVKTRLGPRPGTDVVEEIARIVADNGATALSVHGRYASQYHTGPVRHDLLARVAALGRIPVIGNGGIRSPETALEMARTGVAAVMVGWSAVGNPWLLGRIAEALRTGSVRSEAPVPVDEVRRALEEHLRLSMAFKQRLSDAYPDSMVRVGPEEGTVLDFRCQLFRYLNGMHGISRLRARLNAMRTMDEVYEAVREALAVEAEFRARVGRC